MAFVLADDTELLEIAPPAAFRKIEMPETGPSCPELVIRGYVVAAGDVEDLQVRAAVKNGEDAGVCQTVVCDLKDAQLVQALCNGEGDAIVIGWPVPGAIFEFIFFIIVVVVVANNLVHQVILGIVIHEAVIVHPEAPQLWALATKVFEEFFRGISVRVL